MTIAALSSQLETVIARVRSAYPDAAEPPADGEAVIDANEPILGAFVAAMLAWEAPANRVLPAMRRLSQAVVDFNELRVCLPDELISLIGDRYPRAEERSLRLRAALNDIYKREHAVSLEPLGKLNKRQAKTYLDSLEGVPKYAASRVMLIGLGGHAAPVDSRLARKLSSCGVECTDQDADAVAAALERAVRAGEMIEAFWALDQWTDDPQGPSSFDGIVSADKAAKQDGTDDSPSGTRKRSGSGKKTTKSKTPRAGASGKSTKPRG